MMSVKAKKSLGQNFLGSAAIARAVISAGAVLKGDTVVEVGPGKGILTEELLKTGAKVIAVEKDSRLIELLEKQFAGEVESKQLIIKEADILKEDIGALAGGRPFKVAANIPYYLTGELFRRLFEGTALPKRIAVMVQKEVAERIYARDGKESILSISVKAFGVPKIERIVPRTYFAPPPKVDSAILSVSGISDPFENPEMRVHFFDIVKTGFRHKRKVLFNNLGEHFGTDAVNRTFQKCGVPPHARAENVDVPQWQCIATEL